MSTESSSIPASGTKGILKAIGCGTLAVALLDATDGVIFAWLNVGQNPIQVPTST